MMQLYTHDFSEFWRDQARGELDEAGLFAPCPFLDSYWTEDGRTPLLIHVGNALAGFALIDRECHSGERADFSMAEFFIARKHRGGGIGLAAAAAIFARRRGQWEVAVAARNAGAIRFWKRAIDAAGPSELRELAGDGISWSGPIFRFRLA